ncbi:hypothetical protein ROZALSC1DRAFT_25635 [Rozella allomycis CSF55]|uniref:Uncharacterized protein n=1 Tax=Rozella allomycis (strain CSF55) TaxID=988480 RepID=A0A4P9YAA7_ROZAC|nr:hypothetical protein ROZALSC1DRAFT_25635 [Rozella allomycis CSF55]
MEAKITNAHTVTDDFAAKEAQTPNAENQCQEEDSDEDLEWAPMEADMSKATQGCNMVRVQYQRATILMLHEALQILENSDEYWNGIPALVVAEALRSDTCETIEASTARSFFVGDAQSFDSVIGKLTEHFQCLGAFKGKLQDIQGQSSLTFNEVGTINEDIDDLDW